MPPASARAQAPPPSSPPGCSLGVHTDRYPCPLCLTVRDTPGLSSRTPCEPAVYLTVGVSRQGGVRTHGSSMPSQPPRPDTQQVLVSAPCPAHQARPAPPGQENPQTGTTESSQGCLLPGKHARWGSRWMGTEPWLCWLVGVAAQPPAPTRRAAGTVEVKEGCMQPLCPCGWLPGAPLTPRVRQAQLRGEGLEQSS